MARHTFKWIFQSIRIANAIVVALGIAISPVASALTNSLQLSLKKEIKVRTFGQDKMSAIKILPAGSVVDIPVDFQVSGTDGKVDVELTLNNWLKKAGYAESDFALPAVTSEKTDFFYPVRVVSAPGFSAAEIQDLNSKDGYVALRHLQRSNDLLVVDSPTPLLDAPPIKNFTPFRSVEYGKASGSELAESKPSDDPAPPPPPPPPTREEEEAAAEISIDEAGLTCVNGNCRGESATPSAPFIALRDSLSKALIDTRLSREEATRNTASNLKVVRSTFERTCGMTLNQFTKHLVAAEQKYGISAAVLFSMMLQESAGDCNARAKSESGVSTGLFQKLNRFRARKVRQSKFFLRLYRSGKRCQNNQKSYK
ncbi:MAG: hypothetical protein V4692_11745 [Bdellovibrionota bacterium]